VNGPRELQRLAPPAEQYRPPPHARLVAVVALALAFVAPALPLTDPPGPHLPQRLGLHEGADAGDDVVAAGAAGEEWPLVHESRARDARRPPAALHQPTGECGEERHGVVHGWVWCATVQVQRWSALCLLVLLDQCGMRFARARLKRVLLRA
jgi:hypothetical protein